MISKVFSNNFFRSPFPIMAVSSSNYYFIKYLEHWEKGFREKQGVFTLNFEKISNNYFHVSEMSSIQIYHLLNESRTKRKNFFKKPVKTVSRLKPGLQRRNGLLVVAIKQLRQRLGLYYHLSKNLSWQKMINHKL